MFSRIRQAVTNFSADDCTTLAASLAFYILFALPPLLFLLVIVISTGMTGFYEQDEAQAKTIEFLESQASQLIGNRAATAEISTMLKNVSKQPGTWWKSTISAIGIFIGATGLVAALQSSLNRIWKVKPDITTRYAGHFIIKRFFSFTMILGFGFLLLVSLLISSVLAVISDYAMTKFGVAGSIAPILNPVLTFITCLFFFMAVFKWMPDANVSYKSALQGGLFTAILFAIGRSALFIYFEYSSPGEQLGTAASAVAIILIWVYYSSAILLFGAEFTFASSLLSGEDHSPVVGAVKIREEIDAGKS